MFETGRSKRKKLKQEDEVFEARIAAREDELNSIKDSLDRGSIVAHGSWVRDNTDHNPNDLDILHTLRGYDGIASRIADSWGKENAPGLPIDLNEGFEEARTGLIVPMPWGTEPAFKTIYRGAHTKPPVGRPVDRLSSAIRGENIAPGALEDWIEHKKSEKGVLILQLGKASIHKYPPDRGDPGIPVTIDDVETIRDIVARGETGSFDTTDTIKRALSKHANNAAMLEAVISKMPAGEVLRERLNNHGSAIDEDGEPASHFVINFGDRGSEWLDIKFSHEYTCPAPHNVASGYGVREGPMPTINYELHKVDYGLDKYEA